MIRAVFVAAMLAGCGTVATPEPTVSPTPTGTAVPTPTPFAYPDLPGRMENLIAEGDCEDIETLQISLAALDVDPDVLREAMTAIDHRMTELGC